MLKDTAEKEIKAIVAQEPKMQRVGDPLIDNFREAVLKRSGRNGFRGIVNVLRRMDSNGDRKLSLTEFVDGVRDFGLQLREEDLARLFQYFDRDKSKTISVTEFLRGVRPGMPAQRKDLVMTAFRLLDDQGDGRVTLSDLHRFYDVSRHPEVLAGRKTTDEVMRDFMSSWDKDGDAVVTADEFIEYYTDLSAGIDSDVYFELMIRNAWHISGGQGAAQNTTCLRVLVIYEDGRSGVVEVKNDLGLNRSDVNAIRARLTKQGVKFIKEIKLSSEAK